jgi:polysaccharide pyruvyl transferase WcaK-like protein
LTANGTPGVVVSVRLHGAIASLLAGWPAIHLSYERKGWGAYQDLGLDEWVHDARAFDVEKVAAQARELARDPSPMFARIEARLPQLLGARAGLVDELRRRFAHR